VLGLMQNWPLTVDKIIDYARDWHSDCEIVSRSVEGPIVRATNMPTVKHVVVFVDDIPLGATGKIDKKFVRERMKDYVLPTCGA